MPPAKLPHVLPRSLGMLLGISVAPCRAHELVHPVGLHRSHARL
jgi:hypothetical protein